VASVVVLEDEPLLLEELEDFLEDRGHRATAVGASRRFARRGLRESSTSSPR